MNNKDDVGNKNNDNTQGIISDDGTSIASEKFEVGSPVRKLFTGIGWYNGTVEKLTNSFPTDVEYVIRFTGREV